MLFSEVEALDRATDRLQIARTHMRVDLRRLRTLVPQQLLDVPQVGAAFQQVRGIAMTEPMQRGRSLYQRQD